MMDFFSENWLWIVLIPVGLVVLPYLLGPILIRTTMKQSAEPHVDTFDPDHPKLPRDVRRHFRAVTEQLAVEGFEPVAGLALPEQTTNVKAVILMFVNRPERDAAIATVMYGEGGDGSRMRMEYVEIVSRFKDGTLVQTNNAEIIGAFPQRANTVTTQFPTVRDAARLYRLHRAMVERDGPDAKKVLRLDSEFGGDPAEYLTFAMLEELEAQVPIGYMYLDRSNKVYRPTWKGAFLMTWKELWPFKHIRLAARNRKARRLIAELEGDEGEDD